MNPSLAAVLYLANLTLSGFANAYYSAAALAGSQSWSAWFFGSVDSAGFITIDKPPLATMLPTVAVPKVSEAARTTLPLVA